ncbi:hypothetical protein CEXT_112511 [Caerostris extrusa]|uniref:Uncharacterized protein n=1 Tax=Caerostris extrusa TaxID=172846 RepID=A0AAV4X5L1_CAEEX|nr:hypothetical protein CEXT_112511 [Caerostris extrusa]
MPFYATLNLNRITKTTVKDALSRFDTPVHHRACQYPIRLRRFSPDRLQVPVFISHEYRIEIISPPFRHPSCALIESCGGGYLESGRSDVRISIWMRFCAWLAMETNLFLAKHCVKGALEYFLVYYMGPDGSVA